MLVAAECLETLLAAGVPPTFCFSARTMSRGASTNFLLEALAPIASTASAPVAKAMDGKAALSQPSAAATAEAMIVIETALREIGAGGAKLAEQPLQARPHRSHTHRMPSICEIRARACACEPLQAVVDRLGAITGMDCSGFRKQIQELAARHLGQTHRVTIPPQEQVCVPPVA